MSKSDFSCTKESTNYVYEKQIRKIAEVLGLGSPFPSGDSLQMCCPVHYEEHPSYGINAINGLFNCFACGFKGHISKLPYYLRCNILAEEIDNIEEFEITAKIDTVGYSAKPTGGEIGSIRNRLVTIPLSKYTINELLNLITTGHTVSLSGAKKNQEWQGQQVVMIDIDNDCQFTITDILDYAQSIGLTPSFAYHTYNSTEDYCRCRLGYVFKEPITDKQEYQDILKRLINLFQDYSVDTNCTDLCRMFYGTMNKEAYTSNLVYHHRFTAEQINEVEIIISKKGHKDKKRTATSDNADNEIEETDISDYMEGKKFRHDKLAMDIINQNHIVRMNHNQLYYYEKGIYIRDIYRDIEQIVAKDFSILDIARRKEITEFIAVAPGIGRIENNSEFLACKNGILNFKTLEKQDFNSNIILTHKINADYIPFDTSMSNTFVDNFMSQVTDENKDMEKLIYEVIGASCIKQNVLGKCFIFNRFWRKWEINNI